MGTHFKYGAPAGYARVVRRFVDVGLPLTLNVCGRALELTPWVADDARQHGFEMCGRSWRWESPAGMDEAAGRTAVAKTIATIGRLGGRAPVGWHCKGPRSPRTRRLPREHGGFRYDSVDYGHDLPHSLDAGDGGLPNLVLPYGFDPNDMRFLDRGGFVRAADCSGYIGDEIDALIEEAKRSPRMLTIGLHARIIGRPARIVGLDALPRQIAARGESVCVMTRKAIARCWLAEQPQQVT